MKKIIVASTNPVKIEATQQGFLTMFPEQPFVIEGVTVPSGVRDQPQGDGETLLGAQNRAAGAAAGWAGDYFVGIEGGVWQADDEMQVFAWIVVRDAAGRVGKSRTGTFFLPREVARLVQTGLELGDADDRVFGTVNSKQVNGSIGLLTGNVMTRTSYYFPAVMMALIPFKNPHLSF